MTTMENGEEVVLGDLITTSEFIASDFGDNTLFFKHEKGEDINCNE